MKISYRTHPILKFIETSNFDLLQIDPTDNAHIFLQIRKWYKKYSLAFKNVTVLSIPFIEASAKAQNKLMGLYADITSDGMDVPVKGTFIAGIGNTMIYRAFNEGWGKVETAMFGFTNSGYPIFSFVENKETQGGQHGEGVISGKFSKANSISPVKAREWLLLKVADMETVQMFKSYAQVETKLLAAGQKLKAVDCSYKNETKSNVQILDSKWFTTLVKSDAFKVRGHFRLQPKKKDGEWTKELIWINEFQKEGYTAPARKLQSQD